MLRGKVNWFNDLKGHGFILSHDFPDAVYVRFHDILAPGYKTLKKGDDVIFDVEKSTAGVKATNVTKM